jgi:hypothetical protein
MRIVTLFTVVAAAACVESVDDSGRRKKEPGESL